MHLIVFLWEIEYFSHLALLFSSINLLFSRWTIGAKNIARHHCFTGSREMGKFSDVIPNSFLFLFVCATASSQLGADNFSPIWLSIENCFPAVAGLARKSRKLGSTFFGLSSYHDLFISDFEGFTRGEKLGSWMGSLRWGFSRFVYKLRRKFSKKPFAVKSFRY